MAWRIALAPARDTDGDGDRTLRGLGGAADNADAADNAVDNADADADGSDNRWCCRKCELASWKSFRDPRWGLVEGDDAIREAMQV
mmetsp:Transcript_13483/g.31527  ORF Transcript_13483/g.31527 Transcript_13483/m.31527 type:complete len:86 (-) Transcript_13483:198-455(-)